MRQIGTYDLQVVDLRRFLFQLFVLHGLQLRLQFVEQSHVIILRLVLFLVDVKELPFVPVVGERGDGQRLVRPSGRYEVAYQRHVARRALGCQVRETDNQSAQQNLRYEQHGNVDVDGHDGIQTL